MNLVDEHYQRGILKLRALILGTDPSGLLTVVS